ncbi:MAG: Na+/H+ antiporter NhaC family protein [Clostridiales Family XIII bacterium]|jgi:Na+/H+ antiporter NhaC|nr:Na+/H+ antiporter NhaC family protein [Clostridiales Family XIII bacterium]
MASEITNPVYFGTFLALVPPIVAIALALITKEVYSSLLIGIVIGGILFSGFSFEGTVLHVFRDGFLVVLSDPWNVGILIFLAVLGMVVVMMNRAGGSRAFGAWAGARIKTRVGAQLATVCLGLLIFIDDYFNCLTVGSIMRPVTDTHRISRAKLAYLIDATAAPVCIIAPVSSWAAAVTGFVEGEDGFLIFLRAIPFNFYAILTVVMMFALVLLRVDYGPMRVHERNAAAGDLYTTEARPYAHAEGSPSEQEGRGTMLDLVLPILVLIAGCITGMLYTGGFFEGKTVAEAFAASDASVGLLLGSAAGFAVTLILYLVRRVLPFARCMECIPEGLKAMAPAILILTFAWTLKEMTGSLGADVFVAGAMEKSAAGFANFLPAIIFVVAALLAFATGTSWGTFGILIPIVVAVFEKNDPVLMIIGMSACLAGAVCGDHCSPISDTTIMASAGAQCDHVSHVTTQLPYALTAAAVSCAGFVLAGFVRSAAVCLPVTIAALIGVLLLIRRRQAGRRGQISLK